MKTPSTSLTLLLLPFTSSVLLFLPTYTSAQDRHFAWSYDSPNLPPGGVDIEPWLTFQQGSHLGFFRSYQSRFELELGILPWLQTSFYLNATHKLREVPDGTRSSLQASSSFSFSQALKFAFLHPSIHPVGAGLYLEYYLGPHETELEARFILDKWIGPHVFTLNITPEWEWEYEEENGKISTEENQEWIQAFGYMYMVRMRPPALGVGAEILHIYVPGKGTSSAWNLYAGPTFLLARTGQRAGFFLIWNTAFLVQGTQPLSHFQMRWILGITF